MFFSTLVHRRDTLTTIATWDLPMPTSTLLRSVCLALPLLFSCSTPQPPAEAAKVPTREEAARLVAPGDELTFGATPLLPSAFDQQLPALSSDGAGFLAVWVDARVHGTGNIRGARMAADGTLADPVGFAIGEPVDNYRVAAPGIAWNGNEHLVVWQRGIDSQYTSVLATVESALVSPSGAIRRSNSAPRLSVTQPHAMKVAAGAHGFLAVWTIGARIHGLLFDEAGVPAARSMEMVAGTNLGEDVTVVFDGTNYLVVWSGQLTAGGSTGIWARRFTESGAPVDASPFSLSGNVLAVRPSATRVGDTVLVAWEDAGWSGGAEWDIQGTLVTPGSTRVERFLIADGTAGHGKQQPALAFDGTHALVAWSEEDSRKVLAVRVTAAGSVVAGGPLTVLDPPGDTTGPSVAFSGGTFLVAGSRRLATSGDDVVAARVSPAGTRVDAAPVTLSVGAPAQLTPRVAWSRDRALMVWSAWNGTAWDIHGVRLDANFQPLDPTPFVISGAEDDQTEPDVVSNGVDFLVVWRDGRNDDTGLRSDIYGARVTAQGAVLDAQGIAIAAGDTRQHPRVAVDGYRYVVGWSHGWEVELAQVSPQGWVSGHVTVAKANNTSSFGLACTTGGLCAVVLPLDYRGFAPLALYRFDALLTKLDAAPLFVSPLEDSTQLAGLTFDGTRFVAAWRSTKRTSPALRMARFTAAGTVLDGNPVEVMTDGDMDVREPQLASDGHAVLVTWRQRTVGSWRAMMRQFDMELVGEPAVALAKQPTDERASSIAVSPAGAVVASWEQDDPAQGAMRVHASTGRTRALLGTACGTAADCGVGGICVDGVCCDSACGGGTSDCMACSKAAGAAADGICGPRADNATCDDGAACTQNDVCQGASCVGAPRSAPEPGPCQVITPVCDPETGDFPTTQAPDGTACDTGECRAGACVPKNDPPDDGELEESGCGCTSGPGAAGTSFLFLLTLAGVLRRRKTQ